MIWWLLGGAGFQASIPNSESSLLYCLEALSCLIASVSPPHRGVAKHVQAQTGSTKCCHQREEKL